MLPLFLILGSFACWICYSIGKSQSDAEMKAFVRVQEERETRAATTAAAHALKFLVQSLNFRKSLATLPASIADLHERKMLLARDEVRTLHCKADSQILWTRWSLAGDSLDVLDVWQFKAECSLVISTTSKGLPGWVVDKAPETDFARWQLRSGDRLVYSQPSMLDDPEHTQHWVLVFETQGNAIAYMDSELPRLQDHMSVDDGRLMLNAAKQAYQTARSWGPPRSMDVNDDDWQLAV